MTLPAPKPDPAENPEGASRPDWLRGTDEDLGVVPTSRAPVRKPQSPRPPAPERLEGLVGPETPSQAPPPNLEEREAQLGVDGESVAKTTLSRFFEAVRTGSPTLPPVSRKLPAAEPPPSERPKGETGVPSPATWAAAASSIPSLKTRRRSDESSVTPSAQEWEDEEASDSPSRARSSARLGAAPASPSRFDVHELLAKLEQLARNGWLMLVRLPLAAKVGLVAAVVLVPFTIWLVSPKEQFIRVGKIVANARQLDGQIVHVRGRVGEIFQVGGGYAYWLMQGRDSIVVFTTYRTPVEKEHMKLIGTVSTGFLDGQPRAAVFENAPPPTK